MNLMFNIILSMVIMNISANAVSQLNPDAEKHISKVLDREIPYKVNVLNNDFIINSAEAYPPGKLTEMFMEYLLTNNCIKDKVIADIGAGCFALGIISAKHGAKQVIGTDINDYAINCANENVKINNVKQNTIVLKGEELKPLLPKFKGKIDLILSGAPWDAIPLDEYNGIPEERKPISRAFYDIDNKLIDGVLSKGRELLSSRGRIFITSAMSKIDRIKELCLKHNVEYKIVKQADIHQDGNMHYILELFFDENITG